MVLAEAIVTYRAGSEILMSLAKASIALALWHLRDSTRMNAKDSDRRSCRIRQDSWPTIQAALDGSDEGFRFRRESSRKFEISSRKFEISNQKRCPCRGCNAHVIEVTRFSAWKITGGLYSARGEQKEEESRERH